MSLDPCNMPGPSASNGPMKSYPVSAKTDVAGMHTVPANATNGKSQLSPSGSVGVSHAGRMSPGKDKA